MIFKISTDPLTLNYSARHLAVRKTQTILTAMGITLVVFIFVATLMLAAGLEQTLSATGSSDNVIVFRNGAENELQSGIPRGDAAIILADPAVRRTANGMPLATTDVVALVSLKKREDNEPSNVTVRGVTGPALEVRESIKIIGGRRPNAGTQEIMVGTAINRKFRGTDLTESIRLVGTDWPVVGIFDAGNSGFNSEIWGDSDVLIPAFRRDKFSSVTFKLATGADFAEVKARLEGDKRLPVNVALESQFYEAQSRKLSLFIKILGSFLSAIFSLGAIIGAMITMYSSVASRTREVGILRALGFSRLRIFKAFIKECLLLGFIAGVSGVILASMLSWLKIATLNFSTFAEVGFGFHLTPTIAVYGVIFAMAMALVGGTLPAIRAARLPIVEALRRR